MRLSPQAIRLAERKARTAKRPQGPAPINVEPSILLVPTALKFLAQELTQGATFMMAGGAENVVKPALNVIAQQNLQVISSPYLGNAKYPGSSEASWYLFGKPGVVDTFEIGAAPCGHFASLVRSTFGLRGYPPIVTRNTASLFPAHSLKGKRTPTVERISPSPQGLPRSGALAGVRPGLQRPRHLVPRVL